MNDSSVARPPVLSRCSTCDQTVYPAQDVCSRCWSSELQVESAEQGTAYAFSTVTHMPPGFPAPSTVGYADFPSGVRVFGYFLDAEPTIAPGDAVRAEVREIAHVAGAAPVSSVVFHRAGSASTEGVPV